MKIKPEHLEYMRKAIAANSKAPTRATYKAEGLSAMRWRWGIASQSGLIPFICKELYEYLDDTHVDTALRHILGDD